MSVFKQFETDPGLVEKGIWVDLGEEAGEWLLAFAGEGNKEYQRELEKRLRPYRVAMDVGSVMMNERVQKIVQEVWAEKIVLGWKGVIGDDKQPIEFTKANVMMVFDRAPALWQRLARIATDHQNYLKSALQAALKN